MIAQQQILDRHLKFATPEPLTPMPTGAMMPRPVTTTRRRDMWSGLFEDARPQRAMRHGVQARDTLKGRAPEATIS